VTREETRCGCFLPDLTRLARNSSTASLPRPISYFLIQNASFLNSYSIKVC